MSILEEIIKNKQKELKPSKKRQFVKAITHPRTGDVGLIAEIKKKSPSVCDLAGDQDLVSKAIEYEEACADAISVVTDRKYFGGSLELFKDIRKVTSLPMLMKDFIIHPYQVMQAESAGADALLIIAALHKHFHPDLLSTLATSSLTPVIEVATFEELSLPFVQGAEIIGVNARNLNTFQIDIDRACSIIKKISKEKTVIAFSGVKSRRDIERFKAAGAKAVLVGELLMKEKDVASVIHSLKHEN
ncbi:indole-3-glycerol phosphate synthase [Candidatus Roizmanbacteria bacterium CG_4_9_14_0_2_um_filter_39_13]|uniref:indole-3-glycerol-phosphate synthase n=2 Tax=Candidatus Roizmaniibacteriota TaxID=1752723 RepID=A0A2M8EWV4_9BACT|nr:MAG: indole-3-glycerol phosphate synthase [Candidatus Roizmanbacteria bacterium CG_4_10_14_0_2_um_filter_39_12]PJC30345.1 MAG: indole-3-glycerol phosphate synthase [Candidatus Roizmanbacteria bacterium CG_4_9_14_0_2_um_filter_39_13]PJE61402.1 MAG: indole-3-glycerol phosphate synthase [Candidatus Roizmanbacteria bacterium CG10_big_fil_rev_8_21_14_0_10_39_12]